MTAEADSGQEDENALRLYPAEMPPTALECRLAHGVNWATVELASEIWVSGDRQV